MCMKDNAFDMYNSREAPLKGRLMCMKTMPLIRTYMYNSVNCL